jgi:integrase
MNDVERHDNDHLRKVCDCSRRKWPKCDHPWHFNFKWQKKDYRFSLDRELGQRIRSKTEAEAARDELCSQIRRGEFRKRGETAQIPTVEALTLRQLFDYYDERWVKKERPASGARWRTQVRTISKFNLTQPTGVVLPLGDWPVKDISTDTIEQFQERRRLAGVFAMNRDVGVIRAVFNWAARKGMLVATPFRRGGVSTIAKAPEPRRDRRLQPGEADRLLSACGPRLRALVESALETGCRRGELLSLQWANVRVEGPRPAIILTAAKTKTRTLREVPISARLRAILEMRRTDPAGRHHPPEAFVFGDEIGRQVGSFKRAWATAQLRAHGFAPEYVRGKGRLTSECLARLRTIDLHFHDLRREAGSRWLDAGVPLHTIQRWLGHSNISQTSTYLAVTDTGSHEAMARFDAARNLKTPAPERAELLNLVGVELCASH